MVTGNGVVKTWGMVRSWEEGEKERKWEISVMLST